MLPTAPSVASALARYHADNFKYPAEHLVLSARDKLIAAAGHDNPG
jgi:hypothetical protein